ncbi:MAG: MT-A70 family methyltransferase [Dehalococcoidales bacterium]|nr:MT-A70 family methyltransferase [Dehalococcoidales bacterium]
MNLYHTILIDPPWLERGGGRIKRGADRHYPLLKTPDIVRVIRESGVFTPAEDCHLYLWTTNNFLQDGLWVVEQLGFRYITTITWAKDRFGLGQYFRGMTEHMLFGVRGRLAAVEKGVTLITAPRRKHSQKPGESYELIERVSPPPRLEMFARVRRPEWDTWGNEVLEPSLFEEEVS